MSSLFINKNLPSYSGLIFSKLQKKFSFKIHVNLAPDVQNMFANFQSKKISNDQELIQSDPISCPQNQKGNN